MAKILQKRFLQGWREFEIRDGLVHCRVYNFGQLSEFRVPICDLHPLSDRVSVKAANYRYWAITLMLLAALLFAAGFVSEGNEKVGTITFSFGLFAFGLLAVKRYFAASYDCTRFLSKYSGQPRIVLFTALPDQASFSEFVNHLEGLIRKQTSLSTLRETEAGFGNG